MNASKYEPAQRAVQTLIFEHEIFGLATSPDGVTWAKYDDPATPDAPYAESDPVLHLGEEGAWDAGLVHQPRVVQTPDGWVMFYRGSKPRMPGSTGLGYATSSDGIHWARFGGNPVLTARAVNRLNFWFTNLLYHDGTYFLSWEVAMQNQTNIHLATHAGPIEK